jgi:hypothetical protein
MIVNSTPHRRSLFRPPSNRVSPRHCDPRAPSLVYLRRFLENRPRFDQIRMMIFPHGTESVGGAFNKMLALSAGERARGVVAFSGGNFAQAVAYAGGALGVKTRLLMPQGTPENYLRATRGYGAEVELAPTIAEAMARTATYLEGGWSFMHPFDDPLMMAGNGTLGLEQLKA